ncbi:MAG: sugar transferase [Porphyromonadaceae bacterium]|nr:sugar transferase [Porphyromonadaceae bacterium]
MGLVFKRIFDFCLALVSLIIFSPLILIIAIAIKLEDKSGTAIYSQVRIGYKGKPFVLYKFRSMRMDAEDEGAQLCQGEKDNRLTKVGAFIRAHHLDEFPQLWNVLKGDMSFVGPRPEREFYIKQIMEQRPDYVRLYALRPGLFSYATLYNGYTDTVEKMIRRLDYDLQYLENASLWTDIKIIFLTSFSIIFGKKF